MFCFPHKLSHAAGTRNISRQELLQAFVDRIFLPSIFLSAPGGQKNCGQEYFETGIFLSHNFPVIPSLNEIGELVLKIRENPFHP
jgi:hypothetical protein